MADETEPNLKQDVKVSMWESPEPSRPGGSDGVHQPIAAAPVHPPEVQPSNDALASAVRAALNAEGRLERGRYDVTVSNGVVGLDGTVPTEFLRQLAQACAESCPGVLVLENRLDVTESGPGDHG